MASLVICANCGWDLEGANDGRAALWRFRFGIYDMWHDDTHPIADSAGDLEQDQDGIDFAAGLPALMLQISAAAVAFHDSQLPGMGHQDLERKIRGIRPTLSRKGGRGVVRIEYDTKATFSEASDHSPRYLARVDIVKAARPEGTVETGQ